MSAQDYYSAGQQHGRPQYQQPPGSSHEAQYPHGYPQQPPTSPYSQQGRTSPYPQSQPNYVQQQPQYGQPQYQSQNHLAPYSGSSGGRDGSHSPSHYGSSPIHQPQTYGNEVINHDPSDPNAVGPDGERGFGTKLVGGVMGAYTAKRLGKGGFLGTLGGTIVGAFAAEQGKKFLMGHRELDAHGEPIPEPVQQSGTYPPQQYQQTGYAQSTGQYAGQAGMTSYQSAVPNYASPYPGQPDYTKKR